MESLRFGACPHDVVEDPEKWVAFGRYLKERIGLNLEFERHISFDDFTAQSPSFSLAYAHPFDAVDLHVKHKFLPLVRYTEVFDEAVVVASREMVEPKIFDIVNRTVACVPYSPSLAALKIELARKYPQIKFTPVFRDNYPEVLMAVAIGEAAFGVILESVWDKMIPLKEHASSCHVTSTHELAHVLMLAPRFEKYRETLESILLSMDKDDSGRSLLARLETRSLSRCDVGDMERLRISLSEYGSE